MKNLLIILLSILSVVSCKQSNFSGGSGPRKGSDAGRRDPSTPQNPQLPNNSDVTDVFNTGQGNRSPVDLVWTIDNSGSMADNIEKVRKNFDAFMASVATNADVKVILISAITREARGKDVGFRLPLSAQNGIQINHYVKSLDPALLAATASCDRTMTSQVGMICGQNLFQVSRPGLLSNPFEDNYIVIAGAARQHFRPGATRAYVFVTDDDSRALYGAPFAMMMAAANNGIAPRIFAFRGTDSSGCSISRAGKEYDTMISMTGGQGFDICLDDWSPHFQQLSQSINNLVQNSFPLRAIPSPGTISVTINGESLTANDFAIVGQQLQIKKPIDASRQNEIKATYRAQ